MARRFRELEVFASRQNYNLSGVAWLLNHGSLHPHLWRGVRLASTGRRWTEQRFKRHARETYLAHNRQTAELAVALGRKWSSGAPLIGRVRVLDLLLLLHFTIDHTDSLLKYTSQLIHCLQVFHAVKNLERHSRVQLEQMMGVSAADASYSRDLRLAALVHDLGKLLTLFGEADEHVDCMNRCAELPPSSRSLDELRFAWNHDAFGAVKLKPHLPPRVADVVRLHSLREVPYAVYAQSKHLSMYSNDTIIYAEPTDEVRSDVLRHEARAFRGWLSDSAELKRAAFVAHFQWFDARSKANTEDIPPTDLHELETHLRAHFPDGMVTW